MIYTLQWFRFHDVFSIIPGLFFEHFEKTQDLPEKKLKAHSGQKTQESGVNLGFWPKNSRKIDFHGLIFKGVAGFWSLLLPN